MEIPEDIEGQVRRINALYKEKYGERDPDRIDEVMEKIGALWKTNEPDLRFGQLMLNFNSWYEQNYQRDIFYLEDDELLLKLEAYLTPRQQEQSPTSN